MALYNARGNLNVSTETGWGLFTADGKLRITIVSGSSRTGLYASNGGYNVVITSASDANTGLYHACGALRVVESTASVGVYAPNGGFYVSGASYSIILAEDETDVLTLASIDDTMTIRSTSDTNDNYQGTPGAKLTTTRASTATYWDTNGILQSAATNTLRRDFDPRLSSTTERCGYLIEEARTNLALQSDDLSSVNWSPTRSSVTANAAVGPTGSSTLDRITEDSTAASSHLISQSSIAVTSGTAVTVSAFFQAGQRAIFQLKLATGFAVDPVVEFDLSAGTFTTRQGTVADRFITHCGNGLYRCGYTSTPNASTNTTLQVLLCSAAATSSYNGDGVSGLFAGGFQLEAGSFASSYIPTTSSTVTRAADLVTLAGTLFPLNQSEGTLYAKFACMGLLSGGSAASVLKITDATAANENIGIARTGTRLANSHIVDGTVTQANFNSVATIADLAQGKVAVAYKLDDSAAAQIGETVQTDIVCTMPTTTQIVFGNRATGGRELLGWLFEAIYLPTRLTNSQLQAKASGYASDALLLMGAETQGLTFSATDQSMSILDTGTPANAYSGELSAKLGSIRSSAGMTYLSSGLLGWGPENRFLQSQTFDNASWTKSATTVTADQATAPDGTTTMDLVVPSTSNAYHALQQSIATYSSPGTVSFYVKPAGYSWVSIGIYDNAGSPNFRKCWFNVSTGVVGTQQTNITGAIVSVGNGVYRISATLSNPFFGSGNTIKFAIHNADNTTSFAGDGVSGVYVWGAQAEQTSTASTYKPTTSAAYYGLRLDYDSRLTGGPGYLVEEARTNLALRSQEFDNASWSKLRATVTANSAVAPDGTTTADTIVEDATAANSHTVFQAITFTAATYTYSIYLKYIATRAWARLSITDGTSNFIGYVNIQTGTAGTLSNATMAIQNVGNGWYRVSITSNAPLLAAAGNCAIGIAEADGDSTFDGDGASGFYAWGAQLEAGAFATSYIPTTTATVTRAGDSASIAATLFPFNAVEGTLCVKAQKIDNISLQYPIALGNNTDNEVIGFRWTSSDPLFNVITGGASQASIDAGTLSSPTTTAKRAAARYKANDFAHSYNGAAAVTDISGSIPNPTALWIGAYRGSAPADVWIMEGRYFPTAKNDATLQALSA